MAQSIFISHQHLVFSTKNREPSLKGIKQNLHPYLAVLLNDKASPALKIGGTDDHIHILLRHSKNFAFSEIVGILKTASSKWIKTQGNQFNQFAWQGGYASFGVSYSNIEQVVGYIENQEEHHKNVSFQDEVRLFLKKHDQPFDERYIWD